MTYEELLDAIGILKGLTLQEWRLLRDEVDQQFGVRAAALMLEDRDVREIARLVAMRLELEIPAAANRQTTMEI